MNPLYRKVEILHEDDDILLVNKPPRLLTLPDRFQPEKPNLYHYLQQTGREVFMVHRLDRDTSGLLVVALHAKAHQRLSRAFEGREVRKIYLALVLGQIRSEQGIIDQPLAAHPSGDGRMIATSKGKPSVTRYTVAELFRGFSWVEVMPETGRTHQIRVHLSWLGHPLAVDPLYGGGEGVYLSSFKAGYRPPSDHQEMPLIDRVPLHASRLEFEHPGTGVWMTAEAPLPKDLQAVLNQLRRWGK